MRNIKLTIEYDGTNYAGWQCQTSQKSIQESIEKILRKILQEGIRLIASGRTDAGVHASAQVANFKTAKNIPLQKLQRGLNGLLPEDIVVSKIEEVPLSFHSRFSARSKIYRYTILNRPYPSAFLKNSAYFYPYPLDIGLMRKSAKSLLGRHDFRAFCASGSSAKSTIRTIKRIAIKKSTTNRKLQTANPAVITIDIEADGFLYNMVRRIVGGLIEIGRGRTKKLSGPTAPACGLCLVKVGYD